MNNPNPNPLVPQGSVLEQQAKRRSLVRLALFIVVAGHVVFLTPLLIQGCKPEGKSGDASTNASYLAPLNASNLVENSGTYAGTTQTTAVESVTLQPSGPVAAPGSPGNSLVTPAMDHTEMTQSSGTHKIAAGDTLGAIAKKYHVSLKELMAANPNANPARLKINETIVIPASTTASAVPVGNPGTLASTTGAGEQTSSYKVKAGDNLINIAKTHGTTVKAIQTANGMKTTGIKAGQILKIPGKAPAASAPTEASVAPAPSLPPTASLAPTNLR